MIEGAGSILGEIASCRNETLHFWGEDQSASFRLESVRGASGGTFVIGGLGLLTAALAWFIFESVAGLTVGFGVIAWALIREWIYPFRILVDANPIANQLELTVQRLFGQQRRVLRLDTFTALELRVNYDTGNTATGLYGLFLRSRYETLPISLYVIVEQKAMHNLEHELRKRLGFETNNDA
jgi:hypothetical protein